MRKNKESRQRSYCRACGLIVVDPVCPFCSSTIDEPVIYESKIGYRSRFTSITGVFLLIVAGVTPAVVSARETNETSSVSSPPVVVSTTISTASVTESTSTTLLQSSDKNTTQNTKTPTTQKPSRPANRTSTTLFQTITAATLPVVGEHGKKLGSYKLWSAGKSTRDGNLLVSVNRDSIYVGVNFPRSMAGLECAQEYTYFVSLDGGATTSLTRSEKNPVCAIGTGLGYIYIWSSWRNPVIISYPENETSAPPGPFHLKVVATSLGQVFETPWVLVDMSSVP